MIWSPHQYKHNENQLFLANFSKYNYNIAHRWEAMLLAEYF